MKQSRATIFAISALGFLLGLAPGSPLYAQNQSQPQPAACPLEGPSVADTLKYINDALAAAPGRDFDQAVVGRQGDSLTYTVHTIVGGGWASYRAPIYSVKCDSGNDGTPVGEFYSFNVWCAHDSCITLSGKAEASDQTWTDVSMRIPNINIQARLDPEHGQRLARAVSHLIALLQQQYKQSHSDPNDPFAKPQ
jgi:hypothetical protein